MDRQPQLLFIYLHLARTCDLRRQPRERDKLLVLAGSMAAKMGLHLIARRCRREILTSNPGHLMSRYPTFAVALADEDFQHYLRQQERSYPPEKAEMMVDSLGIDLEEEREAFTTDYAYAAALLGTTPEEMESVLHSTAEDIPAPSDSLAPPPVRTTNWLKVVFLLCVLTAVVAFAIWQVWLRTNP